MLLSPKLRRTALHFPHACIMSLDLILLHSWSISTSDLHPQGLTSWSARCDFPSCCLCLPVVRASLRLRVLMDQRWLDCISQAKRKPLWCRQKSESHYKIQWLPPKRWEQEVERTVGSLVHILSALDAQRGWMASLRGMGTRRCTLVPALRVSRNNFRYISSPSYSFLFSPPLPPISRLSFSSFS